MDHISSLRAFCAISEKGSLRLAAASLGMHTSVLSRQIASLEAQVGGRVFHRGGRGVSLTTVGEQMLPRCRTIIAELKEMLSEARGESKTPMGTVNIALVPAARELVPPLVAYLRANHPRVCLRTHEGYSGQVAEWITSGKVDIGMLNTYGRAKVRDATPIARMPMVVAAARGLPLVRGPEVAMRDLDGVPLAAPLRPNALIDALESAARRTRIELNYALESGSGAIVRQCVSEAGLCAIVPLHIAAREYGRTHFDWATLVQPKLLQTTWIAQAAGRPPSPAVKLVFSELRNSAGEWFKVPKV